jgi:hypothetical protein
VVEGPPEEDIEAGKCFIVAAPLSHIYVVMVWRSSAKAQPQAKEVKACHDGAVKNS